MKYDVVVVANGKGKRADLGFNKILFVMKNNKRVIDNALHLFIEDQDCENIIVVNDDDLKFDNHKIVVTKGGQERFDSVKKGLQLVKSEYVLIHDAARPFLRKESLEELKEKVFNSDAAILAIRASDTIKMVCKENKILKTINRDTIFLAQTPQGFKTEIIRDCYERINDQKFSDDASLLEYFGYPVYIVENKYNNKKLTHKEDFENI